MGIKTGIIVMGAACVFVCAYGDPAMQQSQGEIVVDMAKPARPISPTMYGIFYEDINHAADGGLYGELVRNRSFEDTTPAARCTVKDGKLHTPAGWSTDFPDQDPIPGWKFFSDGIRAGSITLDDQAPLNAANPHALCVTVTRSVQRRAGVANEGFWGIPVNKGAAYAFSMFAKANPGFTGAVTVSLESGDGKVYAQQEIRGISSSWQKFAAELTSNATDPQARLTITVNQPGTLWLNVVSLFPKDTWKHRVNGLRPDLAEMLAGLNPAFVRFPGGCFVEGFTFETALRWKKTIGPIEERPGHWNLWGYRSTNGLGYHELLQLCEDLGAAPLLVINCGMTCQGRNPEIVPANQLGEWVQDALDAIEYANGPATSKWGAVRAANGHPEPFGLKYVEIGNENSGPLYEERYRRFYEAIKKQYPEVRLIANATVKSAPIEILDDHYYSTPEFFLSEAHHYDGHDRGGPKIYVGEYAVVKSCGKGNLRAAVAEAAFLTGLERNADVVTMTSYAPLFVNVQDRRWNPDAIVFDGTRCYGTPSYHVQRLFREYLGNAALATDVTCAGWKPSIRGGIGLGTWCTQAEFKDVKVTQGDRTLLASDFAKDAAGWTPLRGKWSVQEGAYRQMDEGTDLRSTAGDPTWTDYTVSLKARKIAGKEGFLILFGVTAEDNWAWWNLGGWGNVHHGIEMCRQGSKLVVEPRVPGTIETGRWYDIRIEVKTDHVRCYLDGQLVHDAGVPQVLDMAAAASTKGDREIILKVANGADTPQETTIRFAGPARIERDGSEIVLTSPSPDDENSLDEPLKVAPVKRPISDLGETFKHTFPPHSVTVLVLQNQPAR